MSHRAAISADATSETPHRRLLAAVFENEIQMAFNDCEFVFQRKFSGLSTSERVGDLVKDPRFGGGCSANHESVAASCRKHVHRIVR